MWDTHSLQQAFRYQPQKIAYIYIYGVLNTRHLYEVVIIILRLQTQKQRSNRLNYWPKVNQGVSGSWDPNPGS